jgi:excisionase family DNA binding protein
VTEQPLVKPSELARFWGLHPRTITTWIREGRLAATRSPGEHYRVRVADVRALCERESLPFPAFLLPPSRAVMLVGANDAERRALRRALKAGATLTTFDDPYAGLFAAAREPPALFALGVASRSLDAEAAVHALRALDAWSSVPIVAFDAPNAARCEALVRAGANVALPRSRRAELARTALHLLGIT